MITFFNSITGKFFQEISYLKYTVEYIEINQEEKFVSLNISTYNFNICVIFFYYTHKNYKEDMNCSVSFYEINDFEKQEPKYYMLNHSMEECAEFILEQDIIEMVANPIFCNN